MPSLTAALVSRIGRRTALAALAAASAAALTLGGFGAPTAAADDQAQTGAGMAMLRVVHASPDAPAVDVLVDGQAAITNFAYPTATEYLNLPAKTYRVQIAAAANREVVVFDAPLTLDAGKAYTVIAAGLLAGTPEFKPLVMVDDLSNPGDGQARVRFVHVSPDAPAVDVAVVGGPVLFANVAYGQYETAAVPAAGYDVVVRPAGTETDVLARALALDAGQVYTVVAIGQVSGAQPLAALVLSAPAMP